MFNAIIKFSLENKLIIAIGVVVLIVLGLFSATKIPLDAVPDITNNQVQIVSTAPTFAPEEMEQLITYPIESGMTNIPNVTEVRSISRYGLSVVTVVFEDQVDLMLARQYVQEQLNMARGQLPDQVEPELMPITTGLGEIYQYVLLVDEEFKHLYDATKLRTIQDWIVKRQLNGTEGIIETSSFGGYLKQYEVAVDPSSLRMYGLSIQDVVDALQDNNQNSGGSYIEKDNYSFYIRSEGRLENMEEMGLVTLAHRKGVPILVRDVAQIRIGSAKRYGAMTMDGQGEVVGGITLMLKGDNSSEALSNVKARMEKIGKSLPEGISIYPYLDRSKLINKTITTASQNLIEGGLIVIFILLLLLGNFRAGLIVASVIPLSMLFALTMMRLFGVSANLMSLGAIDFGIVIDGAVIIVEGLLHTLALGYIGQKLSQKEMDGVVQESTSKIYRSAAFGVLIILVVFIPILTLEGTEGKTFRPMAQTVAFAILGSLILSITYVPMMTSLFLKKSIKAEKGIAQRIMSVLRRGYQPILNRAVNHGVATMGMALLAFVFSLFVFSRMGGEFIPTLEEGDIAMQQAIKPGSSLQESIHTSTMAERILLDNFPEVEHVVSKIGTAEVPTDPMAIEDADVMIILKDKSEWTSANTREELIKKMKAKLAPITWASFEFTQPIQLRFNELMTGAKSDISIKIFGEDVEQLKAKADEAARMIAQIDGAGDVKVDQTDGLQQLSVDYDRRQMAQFGVSVSNANQVLRAAFAGEIVGEVYEEERRFDLVVRLAPDQRQELQLDQLTVASVQGHQVPMSTIARVIPKESPMLISREQARRFINIGVNVRNRDIASLVEDIQHKLNQELALPPGYEIQYGGQFENLENARKRLLLAVPVALFLILLLLYLAFGDYRDVLIIFMAVPFSAIGGIMALEWRGMPFSISSGIGFIALFGISVLNGIVLISAIKELMMDAREDLRSLIEKASLSRLRPVLMTALVAAFGFLPMAVSTGSGAEVQQPLATVVIGGLISSTLLTLVVLPSLYFLVYQKSFFKRSLMIWGLIFTTMNLTGQSLDSYESVLSYALDNHPELKNHGLHMESTALEKQKIGQWAPLELNYQGGQINYDRFDHQFNVNQNLNHFFGKKADRDVVEQKLNVLEWEMVVWTNEFKFSLRKKYDEWAFVQKQMQELDEMVALYDQIEGAVELKLKTGEWSLLDWEMFQSNKRQIEQEQLMLRHKLHAAEQKVRECAFIPVELELPPPDWRKLPYVNFEWDSDRSIYLQTLLEKLKWLEIDQNAWSRSMKRPSLSVGYFMQSLEQKFAFQGVSIGISVSLDQRVLKTRRAQYQIEAEILKNEKQGLQVTYENQIDFLKKELLRLREYLSSYESYAQIGQSRISDLANIQLKEGEIDFLRWSQIQEHLFEKRMTYWEQLLEYNRLIIELSYLTQKSR